MAAHGRVLGSPPCVSVAHVAAHRRACPWQPTVHVLGTSGSPWPCQRACPWHTLLPMVVPSLVSLARPMAVPMCMSVASHCACPWHKWLPIDVPSRVSLAAQHSIPWHKWQTMAAHGRPSQCPYLVHARATSGCPSCMSVAQMALGNAQGTHPALMQCLRRATYPSSVPPQALGVRGTNTRGTNTRHFVRLASSSVGRPGRYKIAQV